MGDMRDRVRGDENWFQRLAESLPGFEGYREREIRRAGDRLVRDHLVNMLDQQRRRLEQLMGESGTRNIAVTSRIGRTQRRLTTVHDRIDHTDYGYTGFFDAAKIDTDELDALYEYDVDLIRDVEQMEDILHGIEQSMDDTDELEEQLDEMDTAIDDLEKKFKKRKEVAVSLVPEDEEQ